MLEYLAFFFVIFLSAAKPGPGIVFFVSLTLTEGIKPTLITALGTDSGHFIIILLLLLGFDLIQAYPGISLMLQGLAILCIFYLGLKYFLQKPSVASRRTFDVKTNIARYGKGLVWAFVNPVNIVIYTAIVPLLVSSTFIKTTYGAFLIAFACAIIFFVVRLPYLIFAEKAASYFKQDSVQGIIPKLTGTLFMLIAAVFLFYLTKKIL